MENPRALFDTAIENLNRFVEAHKLAAELNINVAAILENYRKVGTAQD